MNAFMEQQKQTGGLVNLFNLFSGGALEQMSIFGLGIMPYVSASIIMQLLAVVVPSLERLQKEGAAGRQKINQYTRYGSIVLSVVQGVGISRWLASLGRGDTGGRVDIDQIVVPNDDLWFTVHDGDHPDRRHRLHHVAGRADHRARHRQRHLAHHLRRHRGAAASRGEAAVRPDRPGRHQRRRRWWACWLLHAPGDRRWWSTSSAACGASRSSTPSGWRGGGCSPARRPTSR